MILGFILIVAMSALARADDVAPSAEPSAAGGPPSDAPAAAAPALVPPKVPGPGWPPPPIDHERWTIPDAIVQAVRGVRARPIAERMEAASRGLLGAPYVNEAAGEGVGRDADPPGRYDAFDCLTFVEEVLGIAVAADPLYAPAVRDALRWGDQARAYDTRRHFMEASWIPGAVASGVLADITDRVGPARTLEKTVTPQVWANWGRRRLFAVPDAALPVGTWSLRYLDLVAAAAAVSAIPDGTILLTLRQPRPWVPIVVTHIGLVVRDASGVKVRHATRMGQQLVRDDRLDWYVNHLRDFVNWRSLGIALYFPREQGPRVSALGPSPLDLPALPSADGPLPEVVPAYVAALAAQAAADPAPEL